MAGSDPWIGAGYRSFRAVSESTSASSGPTGRGGVASGASSCWTEIFDPACSLTFCHLYCLQDLPLVFADGFESGNTAVWSSTVP